MLLIRQINAADRVIQRKKVAACTDPCTSLRSVYKHVGHEWNTLTLDTPTLVVRSQMDTKHDIRADNCSRGNRLFAQPAKEP